MKDIPKFPTTPHLTAFSSGICRDDKVLGEAARVELLSHTIVLEEKIDGANLGLFFDSDGELILKNRGHQIIKPYIGQWKKIDSWIALHEYKLRNYLEDRYALFGEWCYARHSVRYDQLPDWFIGFDVYDRVEECFYSVPRRNDLLEKMGITVIPQIARGVYKLEEITGIETVSKYGNEIIEGVYIRCDDKNWNIIRAKYVRSTFAQSIKTHWNKRAIEPNKLSSWMH